MKRLFFIALAVAVFASCNQAGSGSSGNQQDKIASYKRLYDESIKIKDVHTAIAAIRLVLLEDSTNALMDSLPALYGAINNVEACMAATDVSLKRHPKMEMYQSIKVLCLQQIGDVNGQFELLQSLFETTNKPEYLAQIIALQIQTNNLKDANETIDLMMQKYGNTKQTLDVFVDESRKQAVPVSAAAWNMRGYIFMQQKQIEKAKDAFFKALEIYPDFVMPKKNLEAIFDRRR